MCQPQRDLRWLGRLRRGLQLVLTGRKRLNALFPVFLLHQNLHLPFGVLQHLQAGLGQPNPFLENLQRIVERKVSFFQFGDDRKRDPAP